MAILYCYWHVVVKNGNFSLLLTSIGKNGNCTLLLTSSSQEWHFSNEKDGKTFIFRVNLGMWPLKLIVLEKTSLVLRVSTHIYGISKEIDGITFIFWVNLGMWPSNQSSWKNEHRSEGFNTHLWGFSGDRWENVHFLSKPRHLTPQIDHLGKTSPVLRVATAIFKDSKQIDGKMFIFQLNLGM